MIRKTLLTLFGACTILATQAQDMSDAKPQASAPYKAAVGLRYTVAGSGYTDLGITAKYFVTEQSALEAYVMIPSNSSDFLASLSYVWQPKLSFSERFRPYAGVGVGVLRHTSIRYPMDGKTYTSPVAFGTVGVEYQFKKLPLALSVDYRTPLFTTGVNAPHYNNRSQISNIGVGLKYTFR
ncbi:outer membrane beta-barrel protein [Pontibacter lucknowensis]|uniref:Outer membrane protein beta-barrel domain-containing protein n=1 Tax=Pontibacter lucknowensis TaxID=1077936 RepID=A0A1N6UKX9_9BACT|nr:outer membrane beta-barrel protein [Pontibacter lucknowensis]SIQ65976.1 Outer membrane protein beta-barrel domain-containing protein [Pontibacter lucknowensis]